MTDPDTERQVQKTLDTLMRMRDAALIGQVGDIDRAIVFIQAGQYVAALVLLMRVYGFAPSDLALYRTMSQDN